MEKNKNRETYKKPPLITKQNLQDPLNYSVSDLETVDYNDTSVDDLDDLETAEYNNDTSIRDLVPTKKLVMIKKENDDE